MKLLVTLLGGAIFGAGLAWSTMTKPEVVLDFLQLDDLGLLLVLGGASGVTLLAYRLGPRILRRPLLGGYYEAWNTSLDRRTLGGAAVFGLGWGLSGLCPGSAMASLGTGNWPILVGLGAMLAGAYLQGRMLPQRGR